MNCDIQELIPIRYDFSRHNKKFDDVFESETFVTVIKFHKDQRISVKGMK